MCGRRRLTPDVLAFNSFTCDPLPLLQVETKLNELIKRGDFNTATLRKQMSYEMWLKPAHLNAGMTQNGPKRDLFKMSSTLKDQAHAQRWGSRLIPPHISCTRARTAVYMMTHQMPLAGSVPQA